VLTNCSKERPGSIAAKRGYMGDLSMEDYLEKKTMRNQIRGFFSAGSKEQH